MKQSNSSLPRRSFFRTAGAQITWIGAAAGIAVPAIAAQSPQDRKWEPKRHTQDDWLDQIPGQHRLVFDTTEPNGLNSALLYATNYYVANQSSYGLQNNDLAVVIVVRHFSTPFAYNDSIWMKYGEAIWSFIDKNKPPQKTNTYGRQMNGMVGRGAQFAVCQMATRAIAGMIAQGAGANETDIVNEISANLLPNSHMVPAGIVAVGRAQERGYSLVHSG